MPLSFSRVHLQSFEIDSQMEIDGAFATEIERCRNEIVVNSIKLKDVQSFVEREN